MPSLVVVPLALKGIPAVEGAKVGAILVGGWMATLLVAGFTAMQVRKMVNTELLPVDPVPKAAPFTSMERFSWIFVMLLSLHMAVRCPTALGPVAITAAPFLHAATVLGYLMGTSLRETATNVFHPILACVLSAELGAFALGIATGKGFAATLGSPGAGDMLNGFLGSVILSFAFSMYRQRKELDTDSKAAAAEIITAVVVSSAFSLYSTAAVGRFLGLLPSLRTAIIPHCVTLALALPIASVLCRLGGLDNTGRNPTVTAAVVVIMGLVGANFAQVVMDKFGFKDPIARGMATASSAPVLGTAALARNEPEALPYCVCPHWNCLHNLVCPSSSADLIAHDSRSSLKDSEFPDVLFITRRSLKALIVFLSNWYGVRIDHVSVQRVLQKVVQLYRKVSLISISCR